MGKSSKKNIIKKILFLLGSNKKKLPYLLSLFGVSSFFDFLGIGLIGPFIAIITTPERWLDRYVWVKNIVGDFTHRELVFGLGIVLICVFFMKCVAYFFIQKRMLKFVYDCKTELSANLLDAYQRMPYYMHLSRNSAQLIVNINTHTTTFADSIVLQTLRGCVEVFVLVALVTLLALINIWAMIIITLYFTILLFVWDKMYKKRLFEYGRLKSNAEASVIKAVNHAIGALKEIRLLGRESYFHSEVLDNSNKIAFAGTNSRVLKGVQRYIFEVSLIIFIVGTIFFSMTTTGGDPLSAFVFLGVFGVAAIRILPSITQIAFSVSTIRNALYAVDELYVDLYKKDEHSENNDDRVVLNTRYQENKTFEILECRDIDYKYPSTERYVLQDIRLKIRRGESIGIIGKTGSGKTTLIDILLGLLVPTNGGIYLDGVKISNSENPDLIKDWQSNLIYIPQNLFLIDDTIRRNIAFAVPAAEIDENRVAQAVKESELLDLIRRLPKGLDTAVGERGIRLSGGERQRICIARAFYFGREVIVMDEATSALDHDTETEILKVINSLHGKRTLIVIAHRLSTVKNCDRLFRLEQGRIIEQGSYEEVVVGKSKD